MLRENRMGRVRSRLKITRGMMFGVSLDNIDVETALESVSAFIAHPHPSASQQVFFANVHTISLARRNVRFRECINNASLVLPDGSGLTIAGRVFGTPIRENLNGTDLAPKLFRLAERQGKSVYLFGGHSEVTERCCRNLKERYPGLRIAGSHPGYFSPGEEQRLLAEINSAHPDMLFVALGSPLQELWIAQHRDRIDAKVCFAVGGLFEFLAGSSPRAPRWMRSCGVEWLFRFLYDPRGKWRRVVIEIPVFLGLVAARKAGTLWPLPVSLKRP